MKEWLVILAVVVGVWLKWWLPKRYDADQLASSPFLGAVKAFDENETEAKRRALYESMSGAKVLLATIPPDKVAGTSARCGWAAYLFSDLKALRRWDDESPYEETALLEAPGKLAGEANCFQLNPSGPGRMEFSRQELDFVREGKFDEALRVKR